MKKKSYILAKPTKVRYTIWIFHQTESGALSSASILSKPAPRCAPRQKNSKSVKVRYIKTSRKNYCTKTARCIRRLSACWRSTSPNAIYAAAKRQSKSICRFPKNQRLRAADFFLCRLTYDLRKGKINLSSEFLCQLYKMQILYN